MPKSEVDTFLEQVGGKAPTDPFVKDESDPLANTKVEEGSVDEGTKGTADDGQEDDKTLPFHKDPKVQRYIEKEIGKKLKDMKPAEAPARQELDGTEDELTETLIEIIGNDTPQKVAAVKKFRAQLGRLKEEGAEAALEQIRAQAEAVEAEEAEARETLETAFENIEEEFDVDLSSNTNAARKERSDFVDFIKRISPKDADGDIIQFPDFPEAYKLFKSTQKPTTDNKRAKDLASRSMARSTDSGATPTGGKTWKDVDRIFSKIQQ